MNSSTVSSTPLAEFHLWEKMKRRRALISFDLELTGRCNNNCKHCYINLPAQDKMAKAEELSFKEIKEIVDEAVSLGALWNLVTGGEPLLREDFFDIYLYLKEKGLLVSIFTNATLITKEHVKLFKRYPPRDIEISVFGVTQETYECVTQKPGSYADFMQGLHLLLESGVQVCLKTMALRSNFHEQPEIARFCRENTQECFRFDPFLHLRYDGDSTRNMDIQSERLSPEEIVFLEKSDLKRFEALEKGCSSLIHPEFPDRSPNHLFHCGAGIGSFSLSYNGFFRICSSLWHPDCVYDIKKGTLSDAWHNFVPRVRDIRSDQRKFMERCSICPLLHLCMWCPAHAYLETGELDAPVMYFCQIAQTRAETLETLRGSFLT